MRRNGANSQLILPALLFFALLLFFVPEAQVIQLRGRVMSGLSPVLKLVAVSQRSQPAAALIVASSVQAVQPETPPQPTNEDLARVLKECDELRDRLVRALNEINRVKGNPAVVDLPPAVEAQIIQRKVLWQSLFGLDRGEVQGVRLHAGVLHRGAVVGRIVSVGQHASVLALITHRGMSVAARLSECRVEGILQGRREEGPEEFCRMLLVGRECAAKVGELVMTSGYDGAFPAGLWLGEVAEIKKAGDLHWELLVRPACKENALESVHILTGKMPEVPWPVMPKQIRK